MTDQDKTSASTNKPAASDGADELRDAATAAIARGEWQKALEGLQAAHWRRPGGPFIRMYLARVLLELGRAEEASRHLEALKDFAGAEPQLSELRARAKEALHETSATSKKSEGGLVSSIKKRFAKRSVSRKKS